MNQREAHLLQIGAAVVSAELRTDQDGLNLLLNEHHVSDTIDGLVLLALTACEALAQLRNSRVEATLEALPDPTYPAPPPLEVRRDAIVGLAKAVSSGRGIGEAAAVVGDMGIALVSALDLGLTAVRLLGELTDPSALDWAQSFAVAAAAGIGVDPT